MSLILEAPELEVATIDFRHVISIDDDAFIEVKHEAWFGLWRTFEISVDDHRVGQVGRRSPRQYRVAPGWHTISAGMDWVRTETVAVCLDPGERVVFRCCMERFAARLYSATIALLGIVFAIASVNTASWASAAVWRQGLHVVFFGFLALLAICELLLFCRALPWNSPGRFFCLHRCAGEPREPEHR